MEARQWKLAALSEAGCPGSAFFKSGEYWVLQSGQVAFVLHQSLAASLVNFIPKTDRVAAVQFKILSGLLSVIVCYLPYESADNEAERVAAFETLEGLHVECARRGPTLAMGDFNTKIQYRHTSETHYFGPHLFSPLAPGDLTVGDGVDPPDALTVARPVVCGASPAAIDFPGREREK